ncbi:MAG: hypothetical protein LH478_14710 [Chitinophagaceae bacterium]|nr:hypothetical protein [Chitinophagaceae bacterium]
MLNYTTEDLLLYLYQETSKEEREQIEEALENDWDLKEKYDGLRNSLMALDKMIESPRPESIQAILNYAGVNSPVEHP